MDDKARKKIREVIQMVSLEELKQTREREAKTYKGYADKIMERQEKFKIKQDIGKIKAAKLRARFGISSERIEKTGKFMGSLGSGLGSGLKGAALGTGKLIKALGESAEEYQKLERKRLKGRLFR